MKIYFREHPEVDAITQKQFNLKSISDVTIDHYKELSFSVLENFDYLYVYKVDEGNRVLCYEKGREWATIVSSDDNRIVSSYLVGKDEFGNHPKTGYDNKYVKLVPERGR